MVDKFSDSDDKLCSDVYDDLVKFVKWLASSNHDDSNIMMDYDEIVGELMLELVKGVAHYKHLERKKLLAVIKRMMDNRISELRYKYYLTHRKAHAEQISIDHDAGGDSHRFDDDDPEIEHIAADDGGSVEELVDSSSIVTEVRNRLSVDSRKVFDTVIHGNNRRLEVFLAMSAVRMNSVNSRGGKVRLSRNVVANATVLPLEIVRDAYKEISAVYKEVTDGR